MKGEEVVKKQKVSRSDVNVSFTTGSLPFRTGDLTLRIDAVWIMNWTKDEVLLVLAENKIGFVVA